MGLAIGRFGVGWAGYMDIVEQCENDMQIIHRESDVA